MSIYTGDTAKKYANNKYIWEHESDKNSAAAKRAAAENKSIREQNGIAGDDMDYNSFVNAAANYSDYYDKAKSLTVNPVYKRQSDALYNAINNFSYDAESDPAYKAYSKAAKRQSEAAQKNTYANLTKMSGGRNNSYASAATAQVGQAYAEKINDYAQTLAKQAYDKLVQRYQLASESAKQASDETQKLYERYMAAGDADVKAKRNSLEDVRKARENEVQMKEAEQNAKTADLEYKMKLDSYKAQLIKNDILNNKNMYEYQRWLQDPNYEIKDKKLAEAIGKYRGYSWLRKNGPEYLYSKFYN